MRSIDEEARALTGQTVTRVARVFYEHRGVVDPVDGPLELELGSRVVLLDGAGDGERLRVKHQAWEDAFQQPLSQENREYVEQHGKWLRVECSRQEPYSELVGQPLTDVRVLKNEHGRIAGVRLSVATRSLWFVVEFDECHVYWAHPIGFTQVR